MVSEEVDHCSEITVAIKNGLINVSDHSKTHCDPQYDQVEEASHLTQETYTAEHNSTVFYNT
jgi:hypothetical protein